MRQRRRAESHLMSLGGLEVGGVVLKTPFMTASGTAGHDVEMASFMPLDKLGATVVKSLFHESWPGNPAPRVHMADSSMMNAVGLQGPGVVRWIEESLPRIDAAGVTAIASIWGRTVDEYRDCAKPLATVGGRIAGIEVNLSCPNLEGRHGIIAHDTELSARIIEAVCREVDVPVWAKLSANTHMVVDVAGAVSAAGARAVTLINTMLGMQFDVATGKPTLGNGGGGLSGPAIHPIAVRAVHDVRGAFPDLDIVAVGGVSSGSDAIEMFMAGADAVQVGTASFADPRATWKVALEAAVLAKSMSVNSWSELLGRFRNR